MHNTNIASTYNYYTLDQAKQIIKAEIIYYIKQKLSGLAMIIIGVIIPFLFEGDATVSLFILPLGVFLMLTKERVMTF